MSFIYGTFDQKSNQNQILKIVRGLGFLNLKTGPWVAGGAVRRILMEQDEGGDIDIFAGVDGNVLNSVGLNLSQIITILSSRNDRHPAAGYELESERNPAYNDYRLNIGKNKYKRVQLIKNRVFDSVEELLLDFDLTIAMAATDGWHWVVHEDFVRDIGKKELVLNNADQRKRRLKRLAKYCQYGFTPIPGVLSNMCSPDFEDSLNNKGFANVDRDYQ